MSIFRKELETLKPYVPGKPLEEVKREYGVTEICKLASNENPLGPSPKAIEAIKEAATSVHLYPDPIARVLKEKLATKNGVNADQVMIGGGGEELLKLIAMTFINTGDEAVMATPSFSLYKISVNHMGGKSIEVPLNNFEHDFVKFNEAITDKTKLVYICNPNNPTGNITAKAKILEFAKTLREDIVLVLDEAYYEYALRSDDYLNGLDILKERPNTIVLRTFSKVAGLASVRCGYIFTKPEIVTEMGKIKKVFNVTGLAQAAALGALEDDEHIDNTVELNYKSLDAMVEYFDAAGFEYAYPLANFVFVDIKRDSREVNEELLKRGVVIRPGFLWGFDTFLRVSSGTMEQTETFINAMKDIMK